MLKTIFPFHKIGLWSVISLMALFIFGCHYSDSQPLIDKSEATQIQDSNFTAFNQEILLLEIEEIDLLVQRYGWQMQKSKSGLHYMITKEGTGKIPQIGDEVKLTYSTSLLNGVEIYNSEQDGIKQFKVEKSEEISGLHEAVRLMKSGSRATLIIPSYLAYGLSGDGNKIGNSQPLIMKIEMNIISK